MTNECPDCGYAGFLPEVPPDDLGRASSAWCEQCHDLDAEERCALLAARRAGFSHVLRNGRLLQLSTETPPTAKQWAALAALFPKADSTAPT